MEQLDRPMEPGQRYGAVNLDRPESCERFVIFAYRLAEMLVVLASTKEMAPGTRKKHRSSNKWYGFLGEIGFVSFFSE